MNTKLIWNLLDLYLIILFDLSIQVINCKVYEKPPFSLFFESNMWISVALGPFQSLDIEVFGLSQALYGI